MTVILVMKVVDIIGIIARAFAGPLSPWKVLEFEMSFQVKKSKSFPHQWRIGLCLSLFQ